MLAAMGPDMKHLLDTIELGEVSVPSRIFISLMELDLLETDQCITLRREENVGGCFVSASELNHSQSRIGARARHQ